MSRRINWFASIVLLCVIMLVGVGGMAQEGDEEDASYAVQLEGRKTWTLRYGLGDVVGLAASGLPAGQLMLDQSLSADIRGEALSILSVEAHFDDQQVDTLQSLAIRLDTERLDGVLGDFIAEGMGGFAAYGKKMTGLQLEYTAGGAVLTGVASRLEGISETKTYVGQKAHEELTYSAFTSDDPPAPQSYKRAIDGLYAYPLTVFYVEEFSEITLSFDAGDGLRAVLAQYGLNYLFDVLAETGTFPLEEWERLVIGTDAQTLLLLEDGLDLVRDRLEATIDLYNAADDLASEDRKEYPFSRDTAYELSFLEAIAAHVTVSVDDEVHPILDAARSRFFDTGRDGLVVESVVIEVSSDGETFDGITGPHWEDYEFDVFEEPGILEVDFPAEFFTDESAIRVNFDYTVTGGVFMLGLSIIPGSDSVSINDAPLVRDTDYMIDYEIGMLVLLVEVGETDVIRVDYERFAGGIFGSAVDYATYFYGLTLDWPVSEVLTIQASLLQSVEDPGSVADPDSVKTMPNRHTVGSVSAAVTLDGFRADALVAYSHDRFPFDENARINRPNEIAGIVTADEIVYFGHRNGLTVKRAGEWMTYDTRHGLAGRSVQAITAGDETLFVGTRSGLTVISLEGVSPLDRVGSWSSYYAAEDEGLPNASVNALFYDDGTLWVGTAAGLVAIDLAELTDLTTWRRPDEDEGVELGAVTALAGDGESLYVGTDGQLYRLSLLTDAWSPLQGSEGATIYDLAVVDGTLYVASSRGLRSYRDGIGTGWLVLGEPVSSVRVVNGSVVYGSEVGLIAADDGTTLLAGASVTALHEAEGVLWIGTRADGEYMMTLWSYGDEVESYDRDETGIDGRDPFAFIDADVDGHTVEGFVERVSFRRTTSEFTLSGAVHNTSPTYRSIGSFGRSDSTGWDIAGTWAVGDDADLSASHEYSIIGRRTDEPELTMANDLSLHWTFGPTLTASAQHRTRNDEPSHAGAEAIDVGYQFSLRDQFFAERLDVVLSWKDGTSWNYELEGARRSTALTLSVDASILPSLAAQLDWNRPVRSGGGDWSGSETIAFQTGWSGSGETNDYTVDYSLDWSRSIPGGIGRRGHELEFDIDIDPFERSEWKITPGATLVATSDESSVGLNGRLTASGRHGDLSIQGTLRAGVSGLGEPVIRESEKLSLTASYTGIESLRPSLTYSIDRQVALYQERRQATIGHSLTGRATWTPGEIHYDDFSLSASIKGSAENRQFSARIENSYRLDLHEWLGGWGAGDPDDAGYPLIDLRVGTDVNVRASKDESDVDATMTGRLNAAFSQMWSGSFGISYLGGTDSAGSLYNSLLLDLTIAIDF